MKKLNKREKLLAGFFAGAIFVMANVFMVRHGLALAAQDREEIARLQAQHTSYEVLRKEGPYWLQRKQWADVTPPPVYDPSTSDSQFVEKVQASLHQANLRIEEQQLKPQERKEGYVQIHLALKVTGDFEHFVRWLAKTQQAGNYTDITNFTLKAVNDTSTVVANMEVSQIFTPYRRPSTP